MREDLHCPVCRRGKFFKWGIKNGFQIYKCGNCTHVFADIRRFGVDLSKPSDVRRYMTHGVLDNDLAYYQRLCEGEREHSHTNITIRLILDDVHRDGQSEGKNWLDIGSGSGYLLSQLKELRIEGVGIEPGGWAAISAKERKIKVIQGLLTERSFNEKFAYLSATDVLEHQSEPYLLMNLIKYYMAPKGKAYLSFPFADSIPARILRARWSMVDPPTHCSFFTKKSFEYLLAEFGFRIEKYFRYNSSGFRGMSRLGISLRKANAISERLGLSDQILFVLKNAHDC